MSRDTNQSKNARRQRSQHTRQNRARLVLLTALLIVASLFIAPGPATAGTGGRFTLMNIDNPNAYFGADFYGAGLGEEPFVADTDGNGSQELGVYYNGRFTIRRDDGTYWGVTIPGGGKGEVPVAIDTNGDGKQELGVYYNGRFTMIGDNNNPNGSLWGGHLRRRRT